MTSPDKHPQAAVTATPAQATEVEQRPLQGPGYVAEMRALNHPATHILKTWPPYFADLLEGRKHFEARRDDRDFRVGDYLDLIEYDMNDGAEMGLHTTGRSVMKRISYKLDGGQFGIEAGHCVLGLEEARLASTEGREGEEDWRDAEIERQEGLATIYRQAQLTAEEKLCRAEASEKGWKLHAERLERRLKAAQAGEDITPCRSASAAPSASSTSTDAKLAATKVGPDPALSASPADTEAQIVALCEQVFLHGHSDGWRGNQMRRDVQHVDAAKSWAIYAKDALEKTRQNLGEHRERG